MGAGGLFWWIGDLGLLTLGFPGSLLLWLGWCSLLSLGTCGFRAWCFGLLWRVVILVWSCFGVVCLLVGWC